MRVGRSAGGREGAGLLEELVDQRGLAVVDVGDDGDVAELLDHKGYLDDYLQKGRALYMNRAKSGLISEL